MDNHRSSGRKSTQSHKTVPLTLQHTAAEPAAVKQFALSIAKIGVNANVAPNVDGGNDKIYGEALKQGVAHYKGTALPAAGSNILIFGHSSGPAGAGRFTKVFSRLNELEAADEVDVAYNGKTHKYKVASKKIVAANDISVTLPTQREQLTLMTCWPVGTDKERLVVVAQPLR